PIVTSPSPAPRRHDNLAPRVRHHPLSVLLLLALAACTPPAPPPAPPPPSPPSSAAPTAAPCAPVAPLPRPDPAFYTALLALAGELELGDPNPRRRPDPADTTSQELEAYPRMLGTMRPDHPDRPRILTRLAHLYLYLERGALTEKLRERCASAR